MFKVNVILFFLFKYILTNMLFMTDKEKVSIFILLDL